MFIPTIARIYTSLEGVQHRRIVTFCLSAMFIKYTYLFTYYTVVVSGHSLTWQ